MTQGHLKIFFRNFTFNEIKSTYSGKKSNIIKVCGVQRLVTKMLISVGKLVFIGFIQKFLSQKARSGINKK